MNILLAVAGTIIMLLYVKIVGIDALIEQDVVIQFRQLF
jgi:hypothetical protein